MERKFMEKVKRREVPEYLVPYFDEISQFQYYNEYKKHNKLLRDIEGKFVCLKGFSSSTPIVNSAVFGRECLGGGFYFRYGDKGIVVDPGIGFVSLMHRNNIFIDDIDVVIVTHAHYDHNCDVGKLSSLNFDYNKNNVRENRFFEKFFEGQKEPKHEIVWYMDKDTIRSTVDILRDDEVYCLGDCCGSQSVKLTENIELSAIRTHHIENNNETYGISLKFEIPQSELPKSELNSPIIWGYTSDTEYFDALGDFFAGVDVLLFNISDMYISDVEGIKNKRGHLGFDGSINLLKRSNPHAALVSEFCCTNGDYRYEIVKALRENSVSTIIFPSDPGMIMGIVDRCIKCSLCGKDFYPTKIKLIRPEHEYGRIQYICPNCIV